MWPWSEIARLKQLNAHLDALNNQLLWRCELRENLMLKAMRDVTAANKGIRRLKERLKKLEGKS
jgi:hypothetical protein